MEITTTLSKKNHPLIHKIHMSIASQATQTFPFASSNNNNNNDEHVLGVGIWYCPCPIGNIGRMEIRSNAKTFFSITMMTIYQQPFTTPINNIYQQP
jgi:hypothetical protein